MTKKSKAKIDARVRAAGFASEPYRRALEQILELPGDGKLCCLTNPAKAIARQALKDAG